MAGSGTSTPRYPTEIQTPEDDDTVVSTPSEDSTLRDSEKSLALKRLENGTSFEKATVVGLPLAKVSDNLSKEHSEQGKVKMDVYIQYIQAASTTGFALFLLATIAQQGASILGNVVLRAWGEHNRAEGDNSGMGKYLLAYGMSSLGSVVLGATSAILMWVYISLRSARHLHDSVRNARSIDFFFDSA